MSTRVELTPSQKQYKQVIENDADFKRFIGKLKRREKTEGTINVYKNAIINYSLYHQMTPTELIEEALQEEEAGVHQGRRKIYDRLSDFQNYMYERKYSYNYMLHQYEIVKRLYKSHRISIIGDEKITRPKYDPEPPETEADTLPSLGMMQEALENSNQKFRAIITLMSSSGMGISEIMSLTYRHWLDAISCKCISLEDKEKQGKYVNLDEVPESDKFNLIKMDGLIREAGLVVPVWSIKRIKTGLKYMTMSTPESVREIRNYLKYRNHNKQYIKNFDDKLFISVKAKYERGKIRDMLKEDFTNYFKILREKFQHYDGLKKWGKSVYLWRSHSMRRYAGSKIYAHTRLDFFETEWIMGHKKKGQDRSYYSAHMGELREKYMSGLPKLSIQWSEEDIT